MLQFFMICSYMFKNAHRYAFPSMYIPKPIFTTPVTTERLSVSAKSSPFVSSQPPKAIPTAQAKAEKAPKTFH